jgi:GNAT superfamily N-acetyltransferase
MRSRVGVTYVAEELGVVLGYVTVAGCSIRRDDLPHEAARRFPGYPLPALRVARLAVDRRFQRQGLGTLLVTMSLGVALDMADRTGCVAAVVDAKPDALAFYERLGFRSMPAVEETLPASRVHTPMVLLTELVAAARRP